MNNLFRSYRAWLAIPLTCMALGVLPHASNATEVDKAQSPIAATGELYARISARDLDGVSRYLPAEGFTEFGIGASDTIRLARQNFAAFFKSDAAISLHAENLSVQTVGDTAIVTGMRVGSITPKGQQVKEERAALTMVWVRFDGHWQVRHVHLSAVKTEAIAR